MKVKYTFRSFFSVPEAKAVVAEWDVAEDMSEKPAYVLRVARALEEIEWDIISNNRYLGTSGNEFGEAHRQLVERAKALVANYDSNSNGNEVFSAILFLYKKLEFSWDYE